MISKKELLKSKVRKWDDTTPRYNYVLLVPDGTKHDSGYMHIALIGVTLKDGKEEYEICGYPDDVTLISDYEVGNNYKFALVRMDCYYPQGVLRYHGRGKFEVSAALSSMEITFHRN